MHYARAGPWQVAASQRRSRGTEAEGDSVRQCSGQWQWPVRARGGRRVAPHCNGGGLGGMFFARVTRGHSGLDHSLKQQSRSVSPSQHTPSSQGMVGRHPAGLNELLAAAAAPTVGGGREMSWCVAARARCCSGEFWGAAAVQLSHIHVPLCSFWPAWLPEASRGSLCDQYTARGGTREHSAVSRRVRGRRQRAPERTQTDESESE